MQNQDNKRAVVFDLDGTLTNTLEDIADAMNRALRMYGLPEWETDDYRYLVGNGVKILAQRAVRDRLEMAEKVGAEYQAWYGAHSQEKTGPYDGIPELLRELNARNVPVCVLSNKPDPDTQNVIAHYFPDIRFAKVLGQTDLPIKPDPAGAIAIAREIGVSPENFMYLGDTAVDMKCAVNAGMHPIGVLWGFRTAEELTENGAEHLITAPMDLIPLLDM